MRHPGKPLAISRDWLERRAIIDPGHQVTMRLILTTLFLARSSPLGRRNDVGDVSARAGV